VTHPQSPSILVPDRFASGRCALSAERHKRANRKGFFQGILSLTQYFLFSSWQHWIDFMRLDLAPVWQPTLPKFLNLELLE